MGWYEKRKMIKLGKGEKCKTEGPRKLAGWLAGWQVGRPARQAVGGVVFRWGVGLVWVGC